MKKTWKIQNYAPNPGAVFRNGDLSLRRNPRIHSAGNPIYGVLIWFPHGVIQLLSSCGAVQWTENPGTLSSLPSFSSPPHSCSPSLLSASLSYCFILSHLFPPTSSFSHPPLLHPRVISRACHGASRCSAQCEPRRLSHTESVVHWWPWREVRERRFGNELEGWRGG